MPSYPCRHPTCTAYVRERGAVCPEHAAQGLESATTERHRFYDQNRRDQESKAFYNSAEWLRARAKKLADEPVCEHCRRVLATIVHHRKPLKECSPAERVAQETLESVCSPCHNELEAEADRRKAHVH